MQVVNLVSIDLDPQLRFISQLFGPPLLVGDWLLVVSYVMKCGRLRHQLLSLFLGGDVEV